MASSGPRCRALNDPGAVEEEEEKEEEEEEEEG